MTEDNKKLHRNCEEHDAEQCDINDHDNLVPGKDDCGHYVNAGPGTAKGPDLNIYEYDANGRKVIIAGQPNHNLDQDANNGPGIKNK